MATVLVVDDEPVILRLVESILSAAGYRVVAACGATAAEEALERCSERPAVILSDVVMPGTSGPTFAGRVVAAVPGLPVILMSEFGEQQMRRYAFDHGFGFLPKPLNRAELLKLVGELVPAPARTGGMAA